MPHKNNDIVALAALFLYSVMHSDTQELFEKMLIHKFPWVWWSGLEPVEIANKHWGCCIWCEHKQSQSPHSHICVRKCACVLCLSEEKWERVGKKKKKIKSTVCLCVFGCKDRKAFQRHYSIRFMRAFSKTLVIKLRSKLLSKVHIRSHL